jgi:hypothetical protein
VARALTRSKALTAAAARWARDMTRQRILGGRAGISTWAPGAWLNLIVLVPPLSKNPNSAVLAALLVLGGCGGRASATPGGGSGSSPKCGPNPVQLVDFNLLAAQVHAEGIGAMPIAIDAANVYFVFGNTLMRVPLRGGPASSMFALQTIDLGTDLFQDPGPVVVSNRVLLYELAPSGDEQIVSVPTQGGSPTTLATTSGNVAAFTASDTDVYFVDSTDLQSVPVTGGSVKMLSNQIGPGASGVALIGSNLVVTTYGPDPHTAGTVLSVPMQGGPLTTLATNQPSASFPMACGMDVCWYTGAAPSVMGPTGPGFIARLAGDDVTTIPGEVYPWSFAFDGSSFFETVGCDVCSGTLVRIPSTGAPPVKMVAAGYAAVDDECVYVSVADGFDLPSADEGGIPGSGIYSVAKSYSDPSL